MRDLKDRTKKFSIAIAPFCRKLPKEYVYQTYANQMIRSSSSVGANYRSACRAKSHKDFINKLKIVEEEADETVYFLELIEAILEITKDNDSCLQAIKPHLKEGNELVSIFVASLKTAKSKNK